MARWGQPDPAANRPYGHGHCRCHGCDRPCRSHGTDRPQRRGGRRLAGVVVLSELLRLHDGQRQCGRHVQRHRPVHLAHALNVINGLTIAPNYNVIINLAAGVYNSAVQYVVNHPQGGQIQITGDASIAAHDLPVCRQLHRPRWRDERHGHFGLGHGNLRGQLPARGRTAYGRANGFGLVGCHKVTAVAGNVITISVNKYGSVTILPSGTFTAGTVIGAGTVLQGTANAYGINFAGTIQQYSLATLSNVAVIGSAGNTLAAFTAVTSSVTRSAWQALPTASSPSTAETRCHGAPPAVVRRPVSWFTIRCARHGLRRHCRQRQLLRHGRAVRQQLQQWRGLHRRGGTVNLNGNQGHGLFALAGGVALCQNLSTNDNTEHGVYADTESSISCTSAVSTLNGGAGFCAVYSSYVYANNCTSSTNTGWGCQCAVSSVIFTGGGTVLGNVAGQSYPAFNAALAPGTPYYMGYVMH